MPKTGTPNLGGSIVTAGGLVFIGATNDSKFRAFDKDTGEEVWTTDLPASGHATPMTFIGRKSGRQFIMISAGGGNKYNTRYTGKLIAFALPTSEIPGAANNFRRYASPSFGQSTRAWTRHCRQLSRRNLLQFSHKVHSVGVNVRTAMRALRRKRAPA